MYFPVFWGTRHSLRVLLHPPMIHSLLTFTCQWFCLIFLSISLLSPVHQDALHLINSLFVTFAWRETGTINNKLHAFFIYLFIFSGCGLWKDITSNLKSYCFWSSLLLSILPMWSNYFDVMISFWRQICFWGCGLLIFLLFEEQTHCMLM